MLREIQGNNKTIYCCENMSVLLTSLYLFTGLFSGIAYSESTYNELGMYNSGVFDTEHKLYAI